MTAGDHAQPAPALRARARRLAIVGVAVIGAGLAPAAAQGAQSPWTNAITVPAVLEAENYDRGGEGTAYHDLDAANTGGAYRTSEGVDVQAGSDTGGGYEIGSGKAGEWVEYTINVPSTGSYDIGLRVAAGGAGGKAHVEVNGTNVTGPVSIASTGGWTKWTTVWISGRTLTAASNAVLRLALDSTNASGSSIVNVNSITIRRTPGTATPTPTASPAPTPTPVPVTTPLPTLSPGATETPAPTETLVPSPTPEGTGIPEPTVTLAPTATPSPTAAPTSTPAPTPVATPAPEEPAPITPLPGLSNGSLWPSSWSNGPSAPDARFESTGVTVGSKIFVFGGFYDYAQKVRRDYFVFDVPTNKWTRLGNLPTGMAETHLGAATDGRYVYLAGGLGGDVQQGKNPAQWISSRVYRYDSQANTWTQITNLPSARGAGGLALIGRTLHYFGGVIVDINTDSTDHWAYNLDTKTWTTKASMPEPKDHFSTAVSGGQIYTLLGEFGHHVEKLQLVTAHRYNPATNTWTKLASGPQGKSHAESSTFLSNGRIVIAGGQIANSGSTDRVAAYDPVANTWSNLKVLPAKRQGVVVQKVGTKFVITTGGVGTRSPVSNTWLGT